MVEHVNHLINETSPYLQQHAHNPVNWYPWNEKSLNKAKKEDKPIFLSIGYSTCHWCHVMEKESFEDEETAEIMNDNFISIKVDREERPDIDSAYMNFVTATTGSGGWPLNVFLTPEGVPFFGGTYFPNTKKYGMVTFKEILISIAQKYKQEKRSLNDAAKKIANALQKSLGRRWMEEPSELNLKPVEIYNENFLESFDIKNGGSKGAPKFPITLELLFNLYQKKNMAETLFTLRKMGNGGIFDHLEGGFHRYSVDNHWLVPHFEKMLYDNALLLEAYSQAYVMTKDVFYKEKASMIYNYLMKKLYNGKGFYAAQDADSEGVEGKFYVFTWEEIQNITDHPKLFTKYYNISKKGNFEGKNILNVNNNMLSQLSSDDLTKIKSDKIKLLEYREKRVPPSTDTKIITFWNGLVISAMVSFANSCETQEALTIAIKLGDDYINKMVKKGGVWRIIEKEEIYGFLEDHASLMLAFLALYEATFDHKYLNASKKIESWILEQYHQGDGKYPESGEKNEELFAKDNRVHDSVVPSGVSLFIASLFKLNNIEPDPKRELFLEQGLKAHYPAMVSRPLSLSLMLKTLYAYLGNHYVVKSQEQKINEEVLKKY